MYAEAGTVEPLKVLDRNMIRDKAVFGSRVYADALASCCTINSVLADAFEAWLGT